MTILWCGGEDIDFPNGPGVPTNYTSDMFDNIWSRCSLRAIGGKSYSNAISSPVTSGWLHFFSGMDGGLRDIFLVGICQLSSQKGIWLRTDSSVSGKLTVGTFDGTTYTELAQEDGTTMNKGIDSFIDMQISNYGASSVINVFVNSKLVINFSGDCSISGVSNLDCIGLQGTQTWGVCFSQFIFADEDTRLMHLKTIYPNAAGDTNDWTGAYTDIDDNAINDNDIIYTEASGDDAQFNLSSGVVGDFDYKAVKVSSRVSQATGSLGIKHGIKTNSALHLGSTIYPSTVWEQMEDLYLVNPETTNPFTSAEIDALQIAFQSQS